MLDVLKKHPYIIFFGIITLFFSAPGQTFLLSLFFSKIAIELKLSMTRFAIIYAIATLSAALLLNPFGYLLDKLPLKLIILGNVIMMALACTLLAVATGPYSIFCAFFMLRLFGQGVFLLTASTIIAKLFEKKRGKALSMISLGFPLSEVIYPSLALILILHFGWRETYLIFAISTILILLPLQWMFLKRNKIKRGEFIIEALSIQPNQLLSLPQNKQTRHVQYSLKNALKSKTLYLISLGICIPGVITTGLFFHQEYIFNLNHWPISLAASAIGISAICKGLSVLFIGPYLDEKGIIKPFQVLIVMMGLSTLLHGLGGPFIMPLLIYGLFGVSLGISSTLIDVALPNVYGTKHFGHIKGFVGTLKNGISALSPIPLALAIDYHINIKWVLIFTAGIILILALIPKLIEKRHPEINGLAREGNVIS